eukprot:scaffold163417_cov24-Cyclotella_meneghiniana.AAC.1
MAVASWPLNLPSVCCRCMHEKKKLHLRGDKKLDKVSTISYDVSIRQILTATKPEDSRQGKSRSAKAALTVTAR